MHVTAYCTFLLCCLAALSVAQQCNSTFPYVHNATNNIKAGLSQRLRIGILGAFPASNSIVASAIAHEINNNPNILPNVGLDLYVSTISTSSDALLGSLYHISTLKVQGLISGFLSSESRTVQLAAKTYYVPQISSNSLSYTLANKDEYPYFMRTIAADSVQIDAILSVFIHFGWKKAIIVYTNDDYGSGYSRLTLAGAAYNISFFSVGVSSLATKASDVVDAVSAIKSAVDSQKYRIFVYYTQYNPGFAVRAGLNDSGLFGPDYVNLVTTPMTALFMDNGGSHPLNDGVIGFGVTRIGGAVYDYWRNAWNTSTTNPFPAQTFSSSSWYMVDALLNFVLTFDKLLNSGVSFSSITGSYYYNQLLTNNYTGCSGFVGFDKNGDRLGNYTIVSFTNVSGTQVGYFDPFAKKMVLTGSFVFTGGRTTVPRDSPYECPGCKHGTCVEDVGCVCSSGYVGENCDVKKTPVSTARTAGISGGIGVFLIAVLLAGIIMYRRKKRQLVKEVTDKQRSNINRGDLQLGIRIGRGASGEVFKATFRGTEVAVKKIITNSVDKSVIQEFELEVAIMCGLRHPNIILFMGSSYNPDGNEMLLVMEYMARGSLHDVLHNPKVQLNIEMKLHLACQAAQGMNFLHQSTPPIIHRDLKSHNILLDDKWNARISDFGITKFKESSKSAKNSHEKSIGTIYWSAPETLAEGESSEKSDCYAFGIVLWEIFHRKNPYAGRDPVAVALEVIHNNMRPPMSPDVPKDMRDLICSCWERDPAKRPSFQDIMTMLRSMSMKNPTFAMGGPHSHVPAPTGLVYLVNTSVLGAYTLWETKPKDMCEAMTLHNGLIRNNIEMYRGYEAKYEFHTFMVAFANLEDAMNFCIATQVALLHVNWPKGILEDELCARVTDSSGELLWNGLRVQMSVHSGVPNCEHDPSTDRLLYIGPVVDRAQKLLRGMKKGSVVVSYGIVEEMNKKSFKFIQQVMTRKCGELNDTSRGNAAVHKVTIKSLHERDTNIVVQQHPHILVDVEEQIETKSDSSTTRSTSWEASSSHPKVSWIASFDEIDLKESIGKGPMGDYYRAYWRSKEISVKTLINQKLKEDDLLRLLSDSGTMSKMAHPNILPFHAVCLDSGHLAVLSDYMPRGNLKAILADASVNMPMPRRIKIALDVAGGMAFLSSHPDPDMQKHDNLKSNNIMLGKDWEAKITDYGQSNLKDLARTMTSVGSVAWTAPELLSGDAVSTPMIATYSFGIILWEIYTRQVPYANEHPIRVVSKIISGHRPPIPSTCPPVLSEIITECLEQDPSLRPSWDSIFSRLSQFLKSIE